MESPCVFDQRLVTLVEGDHRGVGVAGGDVLPVGLLLLLGLAGEKQVGYLLWQLGEQLAVADIVAPDACREPSPTAKPPCPRTSIL